MCQKIRMAHKIYGAKQIKDFSFAAHMPAAVERLWFSRKRVSPLQLVFHPLQQCQLLQNVCVCVFFFLAFHSGTMQTYVDSAYRQPKGDVNITNNVQTFRSSSNAESMSSRIWNAYKLLYSSRIFFVKPILILEQWRNKKLRKNYM
jgi:hypothetical protein